MLHGVLRTGRELRYQQIPVEYGAVYSVVGQRFNNDRVPFRIAAVVAYVHGESHRIPPIHHQLICQLG